MRATTAVMAASASAAAVAAASLGAAHHVDTPTCRTITLSRPSALNSMSLAMVQDLHRLYLTEPHANAQALYVVRGDGRRSFCAGGDVKALTNLAEAANNALFYRLEYQVDTHIATMPQVQVAMWAGHVLGSGVGVSLHSRHRVACETTRFAMPETQIGAANDVGTSWVFSSLPMKGIGAYMAITGNALTGADVYHAGLATHYLPLSMFDAVEAALAALPEGQSAAACLDAFAAEVTVPPCTLEPHEAVIADAFGAIDATTTLHDIMERLRANGSAFALDTLTLMERISPFGMALGLENMKRQHTPQCNSVLDCFRGDFAAIQSGALARDFWIGVDALLVKKEKYPKWTHKSVQDVDLEEVRAQFACPPGVDMY